MVIRFHPMDESRIKGFLLAGATLFGSLHNVYLNQHIAIVSLIQHAVNFGLILFLSICLIPRTTKLKKTTYLVFFMIAEITLAALITGRSFFTGFARISPMLTVLLSLEVCSRNKKEFLSFIDTLKMLLLLLVLVDLATQILYPRGLYKTANYDINWFLGYKTERLPVSLPMMLLFMLSSYMRKGRIDRLTYAVSALAVINAVLSQGTGCALVVIAFILFSLAFESKRFQSSKLIALCLNHVYVFAAYWIAWITILFISNSQWITTLLVWLNKSPDFSGRSAIWRVCLKMFLDAPILGNGHLDPSEYRKLARFDEASNAHNATLSLMVEGGIIALALFVIIYFTALKRKRAYTAIEKRIAVFIYLTLMIGLTSSIYIFSGFSFLGFWLMEHEKQTSRLETFHREVLLKGGVLR